MMIPWLIVAAEVVTAFAVMHFVKGKKQERKILIALFVRSSWPAAQLSF